MIADDLVRREVRFRDLFWHLVWPEVGSRQQEEEKGLGGVEHEAEKSRDRGVVLEKMVMGSEYKGLEKGKYERRKEWNGYRKHFPYWWVPVRS